MTSHSLRSVPDGCLRLPASKGHLRYGDAPHGATIHVEYRNSSEPNMVTVGR